MTLTKILAATAIAATVATSSFAADVTIEEPTVVKSSAGLFAAGAAGTGFAAILTAFLVVAVGISDSNDGT